MSDGRANFTASLSFERAVGTASLTVSFQRPDNTIYTTVSFQFTICGVSFYHVQGDQTTLLHDNFLSLPLHTALVENPLVVFYCFIQFPDGSTSRRLISDFTNLPSLASIQTDVKGDAILSTDGHVCKDPPQLKGTNVVLPESCSFGFTQFEPDSEPYFAVRLLRYRTGIITFQFLWPDFLQGLKSGELYETSLTISISGSALTSVIAVAPSTPFRKAGGQLLRFTVINAPTSGSYILELGDSRLQPVSVNVESKPAAITFVTPEGSGKNIPWDLKIEKDGTETSCPWASEENRFVFSYVEQDISLDSISPSFGPVEGGATITCEGHFANFSLQKGDKLVIGSYRLEDKYFVSIAETSIVFKLPPRREVGVHSFEVLCHVVVRGVRSNDLKFAYESLSTSKIAVRGASYLAYNNTYMIPFCAKSDNSTFSLHLFADINRGAILQSLEFQWHLTALSTKEELLSATGGAGVQSLTVPLGRLSVLQTYKASVIIRDRRFSTQVSSNVLLQPTFSRMLGVGVFLDPTRSIAYPPVDPRVVVSVSDTGRCFGADRRLTYEWTYLKKKTTLSYESEDVVKGAPSPRRFGREFIIPRRFLEYGEHEVHIRVFQTNNPEAYGTAIGKLNVEPSALKAVIGSGESMRQVSSLSDLRVTGGSSFDPDSPSTLSQGLKYEWRCELSTEGGTKFQSSIECPTDLVHERNFAKDSFVIPSSNLQTVKTGNGSTFLRFSLQVKKASGEAPSARFSSSVSQVIEINVQEDGFSDVGVIQLHGADGVTIDKDQVPYFDTVILSPQAADHVKWGFKLVEPEEERASFLQNPANLLHLPGFHQTKSLVASRHILGIRKGALKPGTRYTFQIDKVSKKAKFTNSVQFSFKTMPLPQLRFISVSQEEGTVDTVFYAEAVSSIESYFFKFHFFLQLNDGSEVCIDGCSGHRTVSFRVPLEGEHTVRCVLVDSRGKYALAHAKETYGIKIRPRGSQSANRVTDSELLRDSLQLGDHGTFMLESINLAAIAGSIDPKETEESERIASLVSVTLEELSNLYRKSQTSTQLAKDYMTITRLFASLPAGHEGLATEGAFYHLCQMMYYTVSNTPRIERFDTLADFNVTLSSLTAHARQLFSSGSSRERLLQGATERPVDVNEKLLEISEMAVPLWATMRGRDSVCGESISDQVGGIVNVSTGTYCTKEHGLSISGAFSRLAWCGKLFGKNGFQRTKIALGEFRRDYISESGVLGKRRSAAALPSVSNGSVSVSTDDMPSHGYGIIRAIFESGDGKIETSKGCLRLTQRVRPTQDVFRRIGGSVICESATGITYINAKIRDRSLTSEAYKEQALPSSDLNITDAIARQAAFEVTSEINTDGRYGVKRKQCKHLNVAVLGVVNGRWIPFVFTIAACVSALIITVGGVKMKETRVINDTMGLGSSAYIERDIYGRDAHYLEDVEDMEGSKEPPGKPGAPGGREEGSAVGEEVVFERKESAGAG